MLQTEYDNEIANKYKLGITSDNDELDEFNVFEIWNIGIKYGVVNYSDTIPNLL